MRSKALVGTAEDRDTTDQDAMCRVPSAECRESRGRPERLNHHYDVAETRAPVRRVLSYVSYRYPVRSSHKSILHTTGGTCTGRSTVL